MDDGFTDADIFIVFQRLLLTIMPDLLPLGDPAMVYAP
jgi:hypothetical protein